MTSLWGEALRTSPGWCVAVLALLAGQLLLPSLRPSLLLPRWLEWTGLILASALLLALLLSLIIEPLVTLLVMVGLL